MCKKRPHHNVCKLFPKVSFCNICNIQIFQKIVTKIVNIQMRHFGWFLHPCAHETKVTCFLVQKLHQFFNDLILKDLFKVCIKELSEGGKGERDFDLDQNSKMSIKPKMTSAFDKLCRVEKLFFLSHFLFLVSDPN